MTRRLILAKLEEAAQKGYRSGILGITGDPKSISQREFNRGGQPVRVVGARSALEARAHIAGYRPGEWLVIVTDRTPEDLGAGVLSHLIWAKVRSADPWEALRTAFKANRIDPALAAHRRELAIGLLDATPAAGWPPAPAGVLTRTHAMSAVAAERLQLDHTPLDLLAVLTWSVWPNSLTSLATLRSTFGDSLTDEVIEWIADSTETAAPAIHALLTAGDLADMVPIGLVAQLLTDTTLNTEDRHTAQLGRVRLEPKLPPAVSMAALTALGNASAAVVAELVDKHPAHVRRVLQRADALVEELQIGALAARSDTLRLGYRQRLAKLGRRLAQFCDGQGSQPEATSVVESSYARVKNHLEHRTAAEAAPIDAAVRLWRWMQRPAEPANDTLTARARRHISEDGWVDRAINDAAKGVDDPELGRDIGTVVTAALARRDVSERAFAARLAETTGLADDAANSLIDDAGVVWHLEDLLPQLVLPMAKKAPVLFLVMDGMSAAAAVEIAEDATENRGWIEAALPTAKTNQRSAALAVLPSVTEVSRASLLCGTLTRGQQQVEREGYRKLTAETAKIKAELFHKKGVDTTAPGALVADGVGAAIDNMDGIPLVTVVLNTIDDALDRSDPAGTSWSADAVKHLAPLLDRARSAGRLVVMTADHGHVVERRLGTQRSYPGMTSGRSRVPDGTIAVDEIEVHGHRVLTEGNRAVLAISEGLRYGPLKAGYHGGASAAEVVVPVIALLPDEQLNPLGLNLLPPQEPSWWDVPLSVESPVGDSADPAASSKATAARSTKRKPVAQDGPTLFETTPTSPTTAKDAVPTLGQAVVASTVFADQRRIASRIAVTDEQIVALVDALAGATSNRLPLSQIATALGVALVRVRGAVSQSQQLLNVEGYGVLTIDADGQTVVLSESVLRDQFEVHR
ncbi:BREX-2 system phosphatase PglZ [Yimella lutea]|nr:BREX-2 system phosphatase PglZ [Yimella lutea]